MMTILPATPERLGEAAAGLTSEQLRATPTFGGWSANGVLAHLRACADVWGGCISTILAEDKPTLRAVNPRTWIDKTDYLDQQFQSSLRAFRKQRSELLAILESLEPRDWKRAATVTGAGKPLRRTAMFYADWLARHERPHIKQIERIANAMRAASFRLSPSLRSLGRFSSGELLGHSPASRSSAYRLPSLSSPLPENWC